MTRQELVTYVDPPVKTAVILVGEQLGLTKSETVERLVKVALAALYDHGELREEPRQAVFRALFRAYEDDET